MLCNFEFIQKHKTGSLGRNFHESIDTIFWTLKEKAENKFELRV